ncbi:hypothetical protein NA57DRAFT_50992 [Rhizodiscina lignyota]|uniref:Uncharacterized protein n=1 Tax=Rhizodiscina lignyota TaxID=1504668 RepID=A0A9P4ITF1_9PEZI|nr:hypothetical protein NA57DRAFT_50992 [Rhizodiscina lignyota]
MQYSIATAITTILLASTFTFAAPAAVPRAASTTINIQEKTGDGDESIQQTIVSNGKLQTTQTNGIGLGSAVNALVVDSGFTCQAFSDAKGATKLGSTFDSTTTASFTDASDGEVDSNASAAVAIGSVCCDTTALFASTCGKLGSGSGSGSDVFPVTIQIDGLDELATQGDIVADGKPHALTAPLEGQDALSVSIVHTHEAVNCEALGNKNAKLGAFSVGKDATFKKPVDIKAITCTVA